MARRQSAAEDQIQMHAYMRLLREGTIGLRAMMTSARARLIDVSASRAPDHVAGLGKPV